MVNEDLGYLARAKQNNLTSWLRNKSDYEKENLIATGRTVGKHLKKKRLEAKLSNLESVRNARLNENL